MRLIGLILSMLALAAAAAPAGAARRPHIVGGQPASSTYPAQAEVNVDFGIVGELCGGTLIASQWVLTAGHCATDQVNGGQLPPDLFVVRLGSKRLGEGQPFSVDVVHRAPSYDNASLREDAALLHLTAPAPQAPLALIDDATLPAADPGVRGRVLGWGYTAENGATSDELLEVDVPVVDDASCRDAYPGAIDSGSQFCAGERAGGRDACQGDSGGPLMVRGDAGFLLAGIVSTGDGCGQPNKFGIYARLASVPLRDWIASIVPEVASAQQAARSRLAIEPTIDRLSDCARARCRAAVRFAAGGEVQAALTVSGATRRLLDLPRRRLALGTAAVIGESTAIVRLPVRRAVRRAIGRAGRDSVRARLHVVAQSSSGLRVRSGRAVRLRG